MHINKLVIAMSFMSALGSVYAQQAADVTAPQVSAEQRQVQDKGATTTYGFVQGQAENVKPSASGKTREQVRAELKQAQDEGKTAFCGYLGFSCANVYMKNGQ